MGKKILLLGGSNCQKNAIIRGKSLGYEMIVADYYASPIGCGEDDLHVAVSTFDIEGCIRVAKEYNVDGVMTMGTDQPVLTAAHVANTLHLPTMLSPREAKSVTNKKIMKAIFDSAGIPNVRYRLISKETCIHDLADFPDDVVIKPLDSQGQRGVFKLDSKQAALEHLSRTLAFSKEKEALLEEYYPSDEITVSCWIQESRLYILTITDRVRLSDPVHIGICTSHRFPSIHMDQYEEIRGISEMIVKAFGLQNGPLYIQMLIGKEGIMVNEIASRIGGAFEDVIIPEISGFSILDAVLKASLGEVQDVSCLNDFNCSKSSVEASVQLMFAYPGIISSITPVDQLLSLGDVVAAGYNYRLGEEIKGIENATARFGHCVLVSHSGSIEPSVEKFKEYFQILDLEGNNLYKVMNDDYDKKI